jgi:hypothetical protein
LAVLAGFLPYADVVGLPDPWPLAASTTPPPGVSRGWRKMRLQSRLFVLRTTKLLDIFI